MHKHEVSGVLLCQLYGLPTNCGEVFQVDWCDEKTFSSSIFIFIDKRKTGAARLVEVLNTNYTDELRSKILLLATTVIYVC